MPNGCASGSVADQYKSRQPHIPTATCEQADKCYIVRLPSPRTHAQLWSRYSRSQFTQHRGAGEDAGKGDMNPTCIRTGAQYEQRHNDVCNQQRALVCRRHHLHPEKPKCTLSALLLMHASQLNPPWPADEVSHNLHTSTVDVSCSERLHQKLTSESVLNSSIRLMLMFLVFLYLPPAVSRKSASAWQFVGASRDSMARTHLVLCTAVLLAACTCAQALQNQRGIARIPRVTDGTRRKVVCIICLRALAHDPRKPNESGADDKRFDAGSFCHGFTHDIA